MLSTRIARLTPYVPGEQPQDRRYLKLNTNENPYPPSPRIAEFLKTFDPERLRLYPDPRFTDLCRVIADAEQASPDQVFMGNGSDEVLSFAFFAFFDSSRGKLLFPEITYSFYPVYCDFYGIDHQKIPLLPDFSLDVDEFLSVRPSCGVIFPNPNAPTGICLSLDRIAGLLDRYPDDRVVAIDEAYIDFGGESAAGLTDRYPNLLVIKTFSKSKSLAGLRLGYAVGARPLIDALYTVKDAFNSYPVSMLSQRIGEIAVSDAAYYRDVAEKIIAVREAFSSELKRLGWRVFPSRANFVLAGLDGVSGETVYQTLKRRGILVRHFNLPGVSDFVRITIGTEADMKQLIREIVSAFHS